MNKEKERIEEEKRKLEEEKKRFQEQKLKQEEEELEKKKKEKEKILQEEMEKEKQRIKEEKIKLEEQIKKFKEEKAKEEEDKKRREQEYEKDKKIQIRNVNIKKKDSFPKNGSHNQSQQMQSIVGNKNNKEVSDTSSNDYKKRTLRESELDEEYLIINDSNNDIVNIDNKMSKNNFMKENPVIDENNLEDYKKIYDKEVSNKIKYELQKDLLNKQKKNFNLIKLNSTNKSDGGKNIIQSNNLIDKTKDNKRVKLTLLDLESKNDKQLKEIENLLKGGVNEKKLIALENSYKDNKEIMKIINNYKMKKSSIENNNYIDDSSSNSIRIMNLNRSVKKSMDEKNFYKNEPKLKNAKSKSSIHNNQNNASLDIYHNQNYYINQNKSLSSMQDYYDLSPFYYISNGNKISKNMWGYNEKIKNSSTKCINNNNMSQEQIIQNKLNIYKEKMYKPFLDKVEKEKNIEFKRVQLLKHIDDPILKNNLETKFGMERGKIAMELNKEKDKINKAIKDYKKQLIINESKNNEIEQKNNYYY